MKENEWDSLKSDSKLKNKSAPVNIKVQIKDGDGKLLNEINEGPSRFRSQRQSKVGPSSSQFNTEVKRHRARTGCGWMTTLELLVLLAQVQISILLRGE